MFGVTWQKLPCARCIIWKRYSGYFLRKNYPSCAPILIFFVFCFAKNGFICFTHVTLNTWFFHFGLMEPYQGNKITISNVNGFKKIIRFSGDVWKTPVLKISGDSKKNLFGVVFLKQFEQSNVSPITILKTDSIVNISAESP